MIEFKIGWDCNYCVGWCDKNISERTYWLHDRIGGPGWKVYRKMQGLKASEWILKLEDEADAIVYRLIHGK